MNLEQVRALKGRIRAIRAVTPHLEFAYGVGLTDEPGNYRLAIEVSDTNTKKEFVERYAMVLADHLHDVDIQTIGGNLSFIPPPARNKIAHRCVGLAIGAKISHECGSDGTVGFFARRNGVRGLVSCNHVIALKDRARPGDRVYGPNDEIGKLQVFQPLNVGCAVVPADCAFAAVDDAHWPKMPGSLGGNRLLTLPPLAVLTQKTPVFKLGLATHETCGLVTKIEVDGFRFDYQQFFTNFDNVIEIESGARRDTFSDAGDSGALIVTVAGNRPVGLLFGERVGGAYNGGLHYANPVAAVLKSLGDGKNDAEIVV